MVFASLCRNLILPCATRAATEGSHRPKQISVPSGTGEGKVSEEWVGQVSVLALGFALAAG